MLFAIAGSQGTGKSTLIQNLSQYYKTIERKTSRSILADWNVSLSEVNNNHELTIKFQDEILLRKQQDEAVAVASSEVFCTERTYADLFVYALVALGKDNQYSDYLNEYYHRCVEAQKAYQRVFYLTAGHFAPVEDGVRGTNQHYSRMVDLAMADYTKSMTEESKVFFIHESDLKTRTEYVAGSAALFEYNASK